MPQVDLAAQLSALITQIVTVLLQMIIVGAVPIFARVIYLWAKGKIAAFNALIVQAHLEIIRDLVVTAVVAAEQKYLGNGQGAEKKKFALEVLQQALEAHGLKGIPVIELEAELESAIKQGIHLADPETIAAASKPAIGFNTADARSVGSVDSGGGSDEAEDEPEGNAGWVF